MRRGFDGLSRQVQEVLGHDPFGATHLCSAVAGVIWRRLIGACRRAPGSRRWRVTDHARGIGADAMLTAIIKLWHWTSQLCRKRRAR